MRRGLWTTEDGATQVGGTMTIIEQKLLEEVFDVLREHYPYVRTFLFEKVPGVKEILAGESASAKKLREIREVEDIGGHNG